MFSGIIKEKKKVLATSDKLSIKRVVFEAPSKPLSLGESVAINGVCSTVCEVMDSSFAVEYMPETLKRTTATSLTAESVVNLEYSLKVGDPLDGHFVYGHVDAVALISKIKKDGYSKVFEISLTKELAPFVVLKGSITLDGTALTISKVTKNSFGVSLVPYTLEHTTLGSKQVGDLLNVEVDMLARYANKFKN